MIMAVVVHAANIQDRDGAKIVLVKLKDWTHRRMVRGGSPVRRAIFAPLSELLRHRDDLDTFERPWVLVIVMTQRVWRSLING